MALIRPLLCVAACFVLGAAALQAQQAPTPDEMAFIYELNRARQNPQRYDTENSLGGILNSVAAQPPLALNENLVQSARYHSTDMATYGYFAHHQPAAYGDRWPNKMARQAGYPLYSSWTDDDNYIESLAANGGSFAGVTYSPTDALRNLIIDNGVTPPGHRIHLLAMDTFNQGFREVGTGYAQGAHWQNSAPWSAAYWAIHTGRRDTDPIRMFGVVYDDANGNGRYDSSEGLPGVTVDATGPSTQQATTNAQGAYVIVVTAGSWSLTCSGGAFSGTATANVTINSDNVEVDFASGRGVGERDFEFQQVGGGPVLTVTPVSLTFNSPTAGTPSAQDTFTVSGVRLSGNVTVSAPSEFEVSTTSGGGFGGSVTLTPSAGTLTGTTIYVRFNPGGANGASGDVSCTADGTIDKLVNVVGTVSTNPAVFASPLTLNLAADRLGATSPEKSYTVSGYNLGASLVVGATGDFQVSLTSGSGFTSGFSIAPSGGTISPTTIYVCYTPSTLGASSTVTNTSGAQSADVTVNGSVTNAPQISVTPSGLTLVASSAGVPSAEQSFTVSGQYLGGSLDLTAVGNFDFTTTSGSGYSTSLSLTPTAGAIGTTTVYVRYLGNSGTTSGSLDCTSTLASMKQVTLNGSIAPPPNITVSTASVVISSTGVGTFSGEKTYTVSGAHLLGNITLVTGGGFEISKTSGSGFTTSLQLVPSSGTVAATTIFVRYMPATTATMAGNVAHTAAGATTRNVALSGNVSQAGSNSGSSSDSGGGSCSAGEGAFPWLLLLALCIPAALLRRRRPCPQAK